MLDALPLVFVLIGLVLYTVLAGADFGAGMWQLLSGGRRSGANGSATTAITRWDPSGRPTTCGSSSCSP